MRAALVATSVVLLAGFAHADDKQECATAYTESQTLRDAHKLLDARARLRVCSRPTCAAFMQHDCTTWLAEVEERIPGIVPSARTPAGDPILDATVTMDGATTPLTTKLDGHSIEVDPGEHELTFTTPTGDRAVMRMVVLEGDHTQRVSATLGAVVITPPPVRVEVPLVLSTNPLRTTGYVVLGVSIVGVLAGGVFGTLAAMTKSANCPANLCTTGVVSTLYTEATVSTVGFVVGGVGVVAGIVMVLLGRPIHRSANAWFRVDPLVGDVVGGVFHGVW